MGSNVQSEAYRIARPATVLGRQIAALRRLAVSDLGCGPAVPRPCECSLTLMTRTRSTSGEEEDKVFCGVTKEESAIATRGSASRAGGSGRRRRRVVVVVVVVGEEERSGMRWASKSLAL
jgi:hypothetical protein